MQIWEYFLLFFVVLGAGGFGILIKTENKIFIKTTLSFSGTYIFGIIFLHLMPEVYEVGSLRVGYFVLLGFFIQLLLEHLSRGIEHGHIHAPHTAHPSFVFSIMLGLSLHEFMEGLPLSTYTHLEHYHSEGHRHVQNHLLYGILLHKIPAAFALALLLTSSKFSRPVVWLCIVVFALMSPAGALVGVVLAQKQLLSMAAQNLILATVIGSLLHISTTILFETDANRQHNITLPRIISIALGALAAFFTV